MIFSKLKKFFWLKLAIGVRGWGKNKFYPPGGHTIYLIIYLFDPYLPPWRKSPCTPMSPHHGKLLQKYRRFQGTRFWLSTVWRSRACHTQKQFRSSKTFASEKSYCTLPGETLLPGGEHRYILIKTLTNPLAKPLFVQFRSNWHITQLSNLAWMNLWSFKKAQC